MKLFFAAKNFIGNDFIFSDSTDDVFDLMLLSSCDHNISVNSSFSWWGAWLNSNPHKIVACPYMWFNANDVPIEDKICEGWSKIVF